MATPNTDYYKSAFSQRRLLFLDQLSADPHRYTNTLCFELKGDITMEALNRSFNQLLENHEALRTFMCDHEGQWIQGIRESYQYTLEDCSDVSIDAMRLAEQIQPKSFQPTVFPLFAIRLYRLEDSDGFLLVWDKHFLISDAVSDDLMIEEWQRLMEGEACEAAEFQNLDFVLWQNDYIESTAGQAAQQYWLNSYANAIPVIDIPDEFHEQLPQGSDYKQHDFALSIDLLKKVKTLCQQYQLPLESLLLTAYYRLLNNYFQEEDIVIACYLSQRQQTDFKAVSGNFHNPYPLRSVIKDSYSFLSFWKTIAANYQQAVDGSDLPFDVVAEQLKKHFSPVAVDRLFDFGFEYIHSNPSIYNWKRLPFFRSFKEGNFSLSILQDAEECRVYFEYQAVLFSTATIQRFEGYFKQLLESFCNQAQDSLADISMLPQQEQEQLLINFNDRQRDYAIDRSIHQLFEEQVLLHSEKAAVVHNTAILSYTEVNQKANQLAQLLIEIGLTKGDFVGFHRERDLELLPAMLGILKAGGAYIPYDKQNPARRSADLINDSETQLLIIDQELLETKDNLLAFNKHLKALICLEDIKEEDRKQWEAHYQLRIYTTADLKTQSTANPQVDIQTHDRAYMLYTSGSTGMPKGTILRHDGTINHILAEYEDLSLPDGFRFLQSANISSDISVWQFLAPVLKGGKVVIIDRRDLLNYERLLDIMSQQEVTIAELVPSFLTGWINYLDTEPDSHHQLPALQWMMMVGEEVPLELVNSWLRLYPSCKVLNGYGPAEASDDISQYKVETPLPTHWKKVPIGPPLFNLNIFILGPQLELLPLGSIGEICVSGIGVGNGYWKRATKTSQSFVDNPFPNTLGDCLYKTGDLGRWLPNGSLEFWGRKDKQIKVRGFRVEKGEVEACLREHPMVLDAVTDLRADGKGGKTFVGYLIPMAGQREALSVLMLRSYLGERLPDYMIPSSFVLMEQFPTNLSDKVDLKALPNPEGQQMSSQQTFVPAATAMEEQLVKIWHKVIGKWPLGIKDNFFEIGGDSLKATQILTRIYKEMGIQAELRQLFQHQTIEALAHALAHAPKVGYQAIPLAPEQAHYELSNAQKRMWIMDQYEHQKSAYNMPAAFELKGKVDRKRMRQAFEALIARHESLRTAFQLVDGQPKQQVLPMDKVVFQLDYTNLSHAPKAKEQALREARKETAYGFNLAHAPLLKARLLQTAASDYLLIINIHHIVTDGWSNEILLAELLHYYQQLCNPSTDELPLLPVQYKDYAAWHNQWLQSEGQQSSQQYWLHKLADNNLPLNLPTDFSRQDINITKGGYIDFSIDQLCVQQLRQFNQAHGLTMFVTLQAFVKLLLHHYTGQEVITIGSPVNGRQHKDLENQIGLFLNNLVLRDQLSDEMKFIDLLQAVKATTVDAFEHQAYPYDLLVEQLNVEMQPNRNPLYDVLVVMNTFGALDENIASQNQQTDDFYIGQVFELDYSVSKLDLSFFFTDGPELEVTLEYCSDLYKEERVQRISDDFIKLTNAFVRQDMEGISCKELREALMDQQTVQEHEGFSDMAMRSLEDDF